MKNHSQFAAEVQKLVDANLPAVESAMRNVVVNKVIVAARDGVAPEGVGSDTVNAIVDSLYKLNPPSYQTTSVGPAPIPPPEVESHPFALGASSKGRLQHLMPRLRACVERAIELTTVDFTVLETIRSLAEQKEAVAKGNSRTMQSKHLAQKDGFAHAVDLGAWVAGKVSWAEDNYADIALAMDRAATELGIAQNVRWGGSWDRVLSDFGGNHDSYLKEVRDYCVRHKGSDLVDLPHYEWRD